MKEVFLIHYDYERWLDKPWVVRDNNGNEVGRYSSYFEAKEEARKYV